MRVNMLVHPPTEPSLPTVDPTQVTSPMPPGAPLPPDSYWSPISVTLPPHAPSHL